MDMKHFLALVALVCTALTSHAGIIYEWQGINKKSPSQFSMSMEFDEATVRSGSFSLHINADRDLQTPQPNSGLIDFSLPYSSFRPRIDPFNHGMQFGWFYMDVRFEGRFLTGSIVMLDFIAELNMSTNSGSPNDHRFTIQSANADYGMGDCGGPTGIVCSGGTGHIRQVSEPAPVALFGLAAVAAFAVRTRNRYRHR